MSVTYLGVACAAAFLLALIACDLIRDFAARRALVDHPNERSLHTLPVPRLGGVGIAVGVWGVMGVVLALQPSVAAKDVLVWFVASVVTAATGLVDDLRPVSAGVRMVIQLVIALGFTLVIGPPAQLVLAEGVALSLPVWVTTIVWVVWIVGVLNIYNFMDGMDGLAGAQAIGGGLAAAVALAAHGHTDLALLAGLLAAASAGFFVHNVGPARIFMGDAGSTMIGFTFAALALAAHARPDPLPLPVIPLALAPFLLDGTFTILRRASRGEAIWKAHRSHLYQRAVTSGQTHRDVLGPYAAWMGAAAMAGVLGARAGGASMLALAAAMLGGLVVTWLWVRRIEARQIAEKP
jgi:Fuc2NAc and GlcNAc transferase